MKKTILSLLLICFAFSFTSFSQDIIYKIDGSKEEAKIVLVTDKEIQYKRFSNQDGPLYSLDKKKIMLITYENGDYETINKAESDMQTEKPDLKKDFARNLISYHLFDLVFGDFTFSYERILANGQVGFKVPIAIGYDYYSDMYNFNNVFYSGIGVNFYPTGQGKWRYFMGPQVQIGLGREDDYIYYYDDYGNYISDQYVENEGIFTRFFVDNGVVFVPVRNFSIAAIASIGIRYFPEATYNDDVIRTDGHFAVNISYRF